ncbi:MAG: ribosome-associated translation inhibitor RaiA [Gammaproteobacteria bacterium]|nr:ribosome-associated translation inhibitor RaiA [Gammaproteobacteria bacterium]MDE2344838.1 ribosome-associated translation inhibitor RaiA [Gammaproteobacteria bacterium]
MQINITGQHLEITPAIRSYIHTKLERLERHFDHVTDVHVVLTVAKLEHRAEATLPVVQGKIFADAVDKDMYAAIDALTDKLDRQIKKYKEKHLAHSDRTSVRTGTAS